MGGLDVAHRPVQVDRLDRIAADEVHDLERLAQLEQIPEAASIAGSAHAVRADEVGRAADRAEGEVVAADRQRVSRVPRVQLELGWTRHDPLDDHRGVEADTLPVHLGAGVREQGLDSGSRKFMPISARMRSDALWIASSSSADTTAVGR